MSQSLPEAGGQAIPFIAIDDKSGTFEVTQQAMMFLESLPRAMKVSIVAIAGPYRSGKSFLANRLLNQSKGFQIGSTTQACTKGIWLWNKPVQIAPDHIMLLIDTEGLASTERSTNIDIKIFSLSILLSSLFLYNQMGPITENSLEDLSLVANLTNYIHIHQHNQKESGAEFKQYFPGFYWVLRDFYHDLEGQTPKQYLEECLQPSSQMTADVLKKNLIREAITKYFKDRECFTLIRPVSDEFKLAHIDDMKWEDLKNDFRKEVSSLVNSVRRKLKPKVINGKVINASMFLQLTLEYTEAINAKETPTVLTAIDRVIQAETMKIQDEVYEEYCHQLNEQINEDTVPFGKQEYSKILKKMTKTHKYQLQKQLAQVLTFSEILQESQKFATRVEDLTSTKLSLNYSASYHFAVGLLKKLYEMVDQPVQDSQAMHEYVRKWANVVKEYRELGKSQVQWEMFCESLVKIPGEHSFVRRELVEFEAEEEEMKDMGEERDEMGGDKVVESTLSKYAFNILEKVIDQIMDMMNDQLNRLKIQLQEAQSQEKKVQQQKKQNDQLIDLQRQQNEDLTTLKHDLEMKIDNLRREVSSRHQEMESLKQVKDMEAKNIKKNFERQIRDKEEEIKTLEGQKVNAEGNFQSTQKKVNELDSEKRKEVSVIQNEIKKLEEDIEELKAKMKNKENNPYFMQVNAFFGEVREYIEEYKKIHQEQEDSKQRKMKLFTLQKQLNDIEYQANQNELKLKKQLDEQLRDKKDELDRELEKRMQEQEQERVQVQQIGDKRQVYEQQLEVVIGQIQEAKERSMSLSELKEKQERSNVVKGKKIEEMKREIQEAKDVQMKIEEKIYMLSIDNKQRQEDKEVILMLLPQIYKAMSGKGNNIKGFLGQMDNEMLKNKVMKLFQSYKIPHK